MSTLAEMERAAMRVCFAAEASESDLEILGAKDRWLLYREMVRDRLRKMLSAGLPRTTDALGDRAFGSLVDAWFDRDRPRTRYIREIVPAFACAVSEWSSLGRENPACFDLLRYEAARWEVAYLEDLDPAEVADFEFDRRPAMNPATRILDLSHHVYRKRKDHRYDRGDIHLCVYRKRDTHSADAWVLNPMAAAIVRAWLDGSETVTESVKRVAGERNANIDQVFVEKLSELVGEFLSRGILLGSRAK